MAYSPGLRLFLTAILGLSFARSVFGLTFGFPYGKEKVRGVNLGGWLVLEVSICDLQDAFVNLWLMAWDCHQPWITPSIFDNTGDSRIIDEWTFGQYMDEDEARHVLKRHWDTWITENDFRDIAAAGWVDILVT